MIDHNLMNIIHGNTRGGPVGFYDRMIVLNINDKYILVIVGRRDRIYLIDLLNDNKVIELDIGVLHLSTVVDGSYDDEIQRIYFVTGKGQIWVVNMFDILPMEFVIDINVLVHGYMRLLSLSLSELCPVELYKFIVKYLLSQIQFSDDFCSIWQTNLLQLIASFV